ncbi:MAG: fluoride efflux transporter CrcB [Pararhodobacter sp.]
MLTNFIMVALGGALGSALRYATLLGAARAFGPGLPLGTLAVNVLGSFAIGVAVFWLVGPRAWAHPLLVAGFLGGFTTFSAFSLDAFRLWENGQPGLALSYVLGSVILSLAALLAGLGLGRALA